MRKIHTCERSAEAHPADWCEPTPRGTSITAKTRTIATVRGSADGWHVEWGEGGIEHMIQLARVNASAAAELRFYVSLTAASERELRAERRNKIEKMAARRRSKARPQIRQMVLAGKTIGQIERATGASERTIKRERAAMRTEGILPGQGQS